MEQFLGKEQNLAYSPENFEAIYNHWITVTLYIYKMKKEAVKGRMRHILSPF